MLTLIATETSPYARKVRIVADILGITGEITLQPANTNDPADPLRKINPLGKMPALVLENGSAVFDSRVIVDYLESRFGEGRIIPRDPEKRVRELTLAALAEGINDAMLLFSYEGRYREPAQVSQRWLDHQYGKMERGLEYIAGHLGEYRAPGIAAISLACALGYADWRKQIDWRKLCPALIPWLDGFDKAVPSWRTTKAAEMG